MAWKDIPRKGNNRSGISKRWGAASINTGARTTAQEMAEYHGRTGRHFSLKGLKLNKNTLAGITPGAPGTADYVVRTVQSDSYRYLTDPEKTPPTKGHTQALKDKAAVAILNNLTKREKIKIPWANELRLQGVDEWDFVVLDETRKEVWRMYYSRSNYIILHVNKIASFARLSINYTDRKFALELYRIKGLRWKYFENL